MSVLPYLMIAVSLGVIALVAVVSFKFEINKYDAVQYLADQARAERRKSR